MQASPSNPSPERATGARRRYAIAGALVGAGLIGTAILYPSAPTVAQLKSDAATAAPFSRAPVTFADIVDKVKPAVVSVQVTGGSSRAAGGRSPRSPFPDLPEEHPFNEFFKNLPKEFRNNPGQGTPQRRTQAQGSGFVISADGYVVTNNHVVDGASKVQVTFDEQNKHEAEVVGTDARTDLALLKIKGSNSLPFVKFAEKPSRVGDWVVAVGNPFGLGGTVTVGIVSSSSRDIGSGPYDFIQIDAAVNRGNSGGPTFNLDGEVIGVNTAIYSPSGGNVGIAFAVPASTASEVIAQLKSSGSVSRGWLGVKIESIDEDKAAGLGLGEPRGALVNEVTPDSPAAASGLKAGDAIVAVNGDKIRDSRELARKIAEFAPGTQVSVDVYRYGKEQKVDIKLGTFPGSQELARLEQEPSSGPASTELSQLGLSLTAGDARDGGVTISEVEENSDAASKGLRQGDIILEVQGQQVASAADVESGVKKAKDLGRTAVLLRVKSGETVRFVAVQLKPA